MLQIFPAIDLRDGRCVRLRQGDYNQETVFGDDPANVARRFVDAGAAWLHLVDLDGAREGRPVNGPSIKRIIEEAGIPCQLGGGLRTEDHIDEALSWGVSRVILGTRALKDPKGLAKIAHAHRGKIVLGLDAKNGLVATEGWLDVSNRRAVDLAKELASLPLAAIVYTDIGKDGMLEGPNWKALEEMTKAVDLPIIASGGVTTLDDVRRLCQSRLAGCIIGRALYEGRIELAQALAVAKAC